MVPSGSFGCWNCAVHIHNEAMRVSTADFHLKFFSAHACEAAIRGDTFSCSCCCLGAFSKRNKSLGKIGKN